MEQWANELTFSYTSSITCVSSFLRFRHLSNRIDLVRFRHLGNHVAEEVSKLREYAEGVVPAGPPPTAPKFDPSFSLNVINNMPDGVVLPSVPSTEVLAKTSGTVTTTSSGGGGRTSTSRASTKAAEAKRPTQEEREKADEMLGQMESNLKHLVQSYDSDATESSSGGESCDESEAYPERNKDLYVPIRQRAQWSWLANRAGIASKWTWLTAQISDLEYRIRQQTEFYRQIRAAKGGVTLGEPIVSWPPHARKPVQGQVRPDRDVPLNCKPVTKDYSRVDSSGRKIIIKEPSTPQQGSSAAAPAAASPTLPSPQVQQASAADPDDNSLGACRTRPVKMIRRRRILSTQGLFRTSARAAKESTVRCDCIHPLFCCSICYGRLNHTQAPDPITQERSQCMALLDHSYHQVLSTVEDTPLDILFMQKIKNRSWADSLGPLTREEEGLRRRFKKGKKEEEGGEKQQGASAEGEPVKKKKRLKVRPSKGNKDGKKSRKDGVKKRRTVVSHHNDDRGTAINDLSSDGETMSGIDGNSPIHSPSVPATNQVRVTSILDSQSSRSSLAQNLPWSLPWVVDLFLKYSFYLFQAWADHIRRKRETAFDIDNIVIPYSIAAATRVERIKYKEILTPTWRTTVEADDEREGETSTTTTKTAAEVEDIAEHVYEARHAKAEQEEKRRWQLPLWKSSGGQRSRSRRQDSCRTEASSGCNTPDPLSPGMVEKVDSLEVNTRPSTPVNPPPGSEENSNSAPGTAEKTPQHSAPATPLAAGSIRNRRRTSSATKSRERNPSEDTQSSRCTTPTQQEQQQQQQSQQQQQQQSSSHDGGTDVPPFEPRNFPLAEEDYSKMLAEMPCENSSSSAANGDGKGDGKSSGPATPASGKRRGSNSAAAHNGGGSRDGGSAGPDVIMLSPGHSSEEEDVGEDTDPDWKCEVEEDDPEWEAGMAAAKKGGGAPGSSSSSHKNKKGHGLSLKIPQNKKT